MVSKSMFLRMGVTKRTVLDGVFVFADEERHRFTAKQSWELEAGHCNDSVQV